jgi:hypothetical protein
VPNDGKNSLQELVLRIAELTHEVSNRLGAASGLLIFHIRSESTQLMPEGLIQATDLVSRATGDLQRFMWELQTLRSELASGDTAAGGEKSTVGALHKYVSRNSYRSPLRMLSLSKTQLARRSAKFNAAISLFECM